MNLDHHFVQVGKLSKDQKKGLHQKWNTFFFPNSSGHLRSDAHQSQIIGGDADVAHTQTIAGGYSQIIEGIYHISQPGFGTPACVLGKDI